MSEFGNDSGEREDGDEAAEPAEEDGAVLGEDEGLEGMEALEGSGKGMVMVPGGGFEAVEGRLKTKMEERSASRFEFEFEFEFEVQILVWRVDEDERHGFSLSFIYIYKNKKEKKRCELKLSGICRVLGFLLECLTVASG